MKSDSFYLLDTNTASYVMSGRSAAARRIYLETEAHARIGLSSISEAELRYGLEKNPHALRARAACESFLRTATVLPWDRDAARAYSKLRVSMNAAGKSLSLMDLLIASHAVSLGAILVSHDLAFRHAEPWLSVVDWAVDLS